MSNETKWTPGTWQAFIPIDGDRWTIASHRGPLVADCGIGENKYSGANAHLIAAAPDMYEALESMLEDGVWDGDNWIPSDNANQRSDAALAKARGEQS